MTWTQAQAVELCRKIEAIAPNFGAHVALTGGTLYKDGERKDADIMFYRIRQVPTIDEDGLLEALWRELGIDIIEHIGWVTKAVCNGGDIDLFFPERPDPPEKFWAERTRTTRHERSGNYG